MKGKQVASPTKWGLGENVVLRVTQLGVNNIRATGVLNKSRLHKCTIIGDKQLQKKGTWAL